MADSETSSVVMVSGDEPVVDQEEVTQTPEDVQPATIKPKAKNESELEDSDEEEEATAKIMVGLVADIKNLYQKYDKHGCLIWTDQTPDDLEEAAENEETLKYAVIVRYRKPSNGDSRKNLEIDSVIIQSPYLKRVLAAVLEDYPGVVTSLARLTFQAPFECFVHRWSSFTQEMKSNKWDAVTKSHIEVLYKVLYPELKDVIAAREDYFKNGVVTYEHVWTVFQPGSTLFASRYGHPMAVKFDGGYFGETQCAGKCYVVNCSYVDWDGTKFGYNDSTHYITEFLGTIPISDLACFPLQFHPDREAVSQVLVRRGQLFESLAGFHFKAYNGQGITKQHGYTVRVTVTGRIVIDATSYGKFNPNSVCSLRSIPRKLAEDEAASEKEVKKTQTLRLRNCDGDDDLLLDEDGNEVSARRLPLTKEDHLLCTPVVRGYSLKTKRWLEFFVGSVGGISFNDRAFDSLVLPSDQKELILAFAQSQRRHRDAFDDVISGKGKGIIMLLSGGPGIGKTLTAESVAEEMRVPLYVMSAGDLGVDAEDVEDNLARILEMVTRWNAVLLLDECDVFLEARSSHDLERNRIVSIFLRTLEYYEGILFLTTNRVDNMDHAFKSRIHVSLEYPPLDAAARRAVWSGFLGRGAGAEGRLTGVAAHCLSEDEVDVLAGLDMNGRQIKNVLKTANLLACHKGQTLAFAHLRTVLTVEGYKI